MSGNIILTTTNSVEGKTIKEYLGIVFGNNSESMATEAKNRGADAVVGIRINEHPGGNCVSAYLNYYGTAVKFK